ncbi:ABC transporter ATP-binding protein [Paraglaciecola aquimarina]|uniref:ABC transporter ATP-binding protein n=1 Tax=Paraglaciecola algarum TaxID=3050085 RepID=A0ABS9D821_9ALTE|nr:ABC transporter ATP-binding protein [Paraglaciecola sp. G1-23]MCF2949122.1 ABC transporter ATP-binding protein [Paraglaciecola sp. G1-23]
MQQVNSVKHSDASQVVASIQGLNKSFSNKQALCDVELQIKSNQVLAILGSNGAGKTTLINTLLGRLKIDSGEISIFSSQPGSLAVKQQTGAMLQVASLPETLKIREHIQLFQSYYPNPMDYQKVIAYAGLESLQERFSKKLSGGEKQRLLFALSICGNPKLLFLDEPSVGMDLSARQSLWKAIRDLKNQGTAIVLTTHYLEEADSLADEIVLLKQGAIIQRGTNEQIKACVSSTTIRFTTPSYPIDFNSVAYLISHDVSGKYTAIQTNELNQTLISLLTKYPELEDLSVSRAGLEEAFLELNKDQLAQSKTGKSVINKGEAA